MKLSKRLLAAILTLAMVLTMVPVIVLADDETPNYLTFTAEEANSSVTFKWKSGTNVQYSTDSVTWNSYTADTEIKLAEVDDYVQFKGTNVTTDVDNHFSMPTGKIAASGDVTSLTNGVGGNADLSTYYSTTDYCYSYMFYNCTSLITAPALPSTILDDYCYYCMFNGCTQLTTAPNLSATALAKSCYQSMFTGCTSLTTAPGLPAETLAESCYNCMFDSCSSLTTIPEELPATILASYCYFGMFQNCTSLTTVPNLPATTLADGCYFAMFSDCAGIHIYTGAGKTEWKIPSGASTAANWNFMMFNGTGGTFTGAAEAGTTYYIGEDYLTFTAQENNSSVTFEWLSADAVYYRKGTTGDFSTYTEGTKIDLNNGDIVQFKGINVKTGHSNGEYFSMSGKIAASGDVTSLTNGVGGDIALTDECYSNMFRGCSALTTAPELPSTTLARGCYSGMFCAGCKSLVEAPELPATTLAQSCYATMFYECESLEEAPALPATTLAQSCYASMFYKCTSLTTVPELKATTLAKYCYSAMFSGCTNIKVYENAGQNKWSVPAEATTATDWNTDMFAGTGGDFTGNPVVGTTYYIGAPTQLTVSGSSADKTYDGTTDATVTVGTVSGVKVGDAVTVTATGYFADKNVGQNKSVAVTYALEGDDAYKYLAPVGENITATITPLQLTVSDSSANKTYDGTTYVTVNVDKTKVVGIADGDNDKVTVTATGIFDNKNAGQNKSVAVTYSLEGDDAGNYLAPVDETITNATISPKELTVEGTRADGKTYDGTTTVVTHIGTLSGKIIGDDVTVKIVTANFVDENAGNSRKVNITYTLSGDDSGNYTVASSETCADIEKKGIEITADDKTSYKGADLVELTYTVDSLCEGDTLSGSLSTSANKDVVGTYDIVLDSLNPGNNYTITKFTKGTYTVKNIVASFETNGAGTIDDQNLGMNDKIEKPTDPVKTGYVFTGWYKDSEFTTEWDFKEDSVTEDITLYAKWVEIGVETPKSEGAKVDSKDLQEVLDKYKNSNADKSVIIKLDVSEDVPAADKALLEKKAGDSKIQAFDTSLLLVIDGTSTDIGGENDTLISVTYKFDFAGKENFQLYRVHDGAVDELKKDANADGEYVKYDKDAGTVTVTAKKYSTYAIVYDEVAEEKKEEVANTADTSMVALFAAMSSLSTAAFVLLKKKEN